MFPLLEFLQMRKRVYPEGEVLEAKIALLSKTNMLDFAADIYKSAARREGATSRRRCSSGRREEVIANLHGAVRRRRTKVVDVPVGPRRS